MDINDFVAENGSYKVSKTIVNELIPIGKTLEYIKKNSVIELDEELKKKSNLVKKLIDKYHKFFIQENLENIALDFTQLYSLMAELKITDDKKQKKNLKDNIRETQSELRGLISKFFHSNPDFSYLTKKELYTKLLPVICDNNELQLLNEFKGFYTYFEDFNKLRSGLYSPEDKSNTIAFRIVNDNFSIFFKNSLIAKKIEKETWDKLYLELKGKGVEKITFDADGFNYCLSQKGIELYNLLIGGYSDENKKYKGINEILNEIPGNRFKFEPLKKMILSDSESSSFKIEKIENTEQLITLINDFAVNNNHLFGTMCNLYEKVYANKKTDNLYISKKSLTKFSHYVYGNFNLLEESLTLLFKKEHPELKGKKYEKELKAYLNSDCFSFAELKNAYSVYSEERCISIEDIKIPDTYYFLNHPSVSEILVDFQKTEICFQKIKKNNTDIRKDKQAIKTVKKYLDDSLDMYRYFKLINYKGEDLPDSDFHDIYFELMNNLKDIESIYNKTRNYITQKLSSAGKLKLNFSSSGLCSGWDISKENETNSIILLKDGKYYLGVLNKSAKLKLNLYTENTQNVYKKMIYKQIPSPNKMLPHVFFSNKGIEFYKPSDELLEKYNKGLHLKSNSKFSLEFCHELIDFFKICIDKNPDWKCYNFDFSNTEKYKDISEFYKELENRAYSIKFANIEAELIDSYVDEGKLYLFEITQRTMRRGYNKNIQVQIFESLFDEKNLENPKIRLNGGAEIFYRPAVLSEENTFVHKKDSILVNKVGKNGKSIDSELYTEIFEYLNNRRSTISDEAKLLLDSGNVIYKKAKFDIIKNKKYTRDIFTFHCCVSLNQNSELERTKVFNKRVLDCIKNNKNVNIMGINRGERNLLYITIIDQKGNVLLQKNLNIISHSKNNGLAAESDYLDKLKNKSRIRDSERKEWLQIDKIKELKEGYITQAVTEICKLMIEYNAIVIMEKLDSEFKNNRSAIEFSIYEKFEKMFITKLNNLVFHNKLPEEKGGIYNPYQLTPKFESMDDIYCQSGWVFFLNSAYISKMCPETGFVDLFNFYGINNIKAKKEFLRKFQSISYNEDTDVYEYTFKYSSFEKIFPQDEWTISTHGSRTYFDKKQKKYVTINLTQEIKNSLQGLHNYKGDLLDFISNMPEERKYYPVIDALFRSFTLSVKMSHYDNDNSYFVSSVKKEKERYFDTRDNCMLEESDSVAAYNLAKKMLYFFDKGFDSENGYVSNIKNEEWFNYVLENN